jgi:environmental stress-induced protein Ves
MKKLMIHVLKNENGKIVPWKNGGGSTLELYKKEHPENPNEFIFRISIATVETSGPFSVFNHIDRTLLLLKGAGMKLFFATHSTVLEKPLSPLIFRGEELVNCELINGTCLDFNIMTDRRYGKSHLEINSMSFEQAQNIVSLDEIFLYQDQQQNLFLIRYQTVSS